MAVATVAQPQYVITNDDKKRIAQIAKAWKAYNGELEKPLSVIQGQADDNVMDNRCSPVVDGGVHFLFGKEIEISVGIADKPKGNKNISGGYAKTPNKSRTKPVATPDQDLLDKIWGRKETRIPLLQDLAMNGAMAGRAFLRIVPVDDTFRLIVVDPSIVYVQTAPQDCETVLLYCIEYMTNETRNGKPVTVSYREEISRIDPDSDGDDGSVGADTDATWSIQHWSRLGDHGAWTPSGEPIVWDYPFPPLFSNKNLPKPNDFWGRPDVTPDIIGINNSLNLVQSSINRILKLFGSPILYATGTGDSVIDLKPGRIIGLPLSESKIVAVTLTSDVANARLFAEDLRSDIDELSNIPAVATGRFSAIPRGDMSGTAIELIFMPALKKTEVKQCTYGELIIDVSQALLVLAGLAQKVGDKDITISWGNPLPHDDLPAAQAAVIKKNLSISDSTLQRDLGYDPEEEAALNLADAQQKAQQAQIQAQAQGATVPPPTPPQSPGQADIPTPTQPQEPQGVRL